MRLLVFVTLAISATPALADWPQWGGPNRNFIVESPKLADTWPEDGPKSVWRRSLGSGYSAIVADADRLYTMHRDGDEDVVVALNPRDGETIWTHRYEARTLPNQVLRFGTGPNATPLLVDDRIVTVGFTGKMNCLRAETGEPIWSHDLIAEFGGKVQEFGYASSPLLYDGAIIMLVGGSDAGVVAFRPADGEVAWKSPTYDISYASPIHINVDGQDQIVFMASEEVIGIEPGTGKKLWSAPCVNQYKNNCTDPVWGPDNLLWVATQMDGACRTLRLSQKNGETSVEKVWENDKVRVFHWNAIRVGDWVYASIGDQVTFLSAVNARTGEVAWQERGFHKANAIYADNKLIFVDENGTLAMAAVSPEKLEIRGKTPLLEKVAWTAPTLLGTTLYVRDAKEIVALDLAP